MKLTNEIKSSVDGVSPYLNTCMLGKKRSMLALEHPLNHGKRLGVIRLYENALLNENVIAHLLEQLTAWKSDDKLIAIWFEADNLKQNSGLFSLYSEESKGRPQLEEAQNTLLKFIKNYPKASMIWRDYALFSSLTMLFKQVDFHLVRFHADCQFIDHKSSVTQPETDFELRHKLTTRCSFEGSTLVGVYPVVCDRSRLLELLSSYPWQQSSCKEIGIHLNDLFKESLALT